jgi:hypothetical protein
MLINKHKHFVLKGTARGCNFKGLSHKMGDGRIFPKNLRASLFNDELSNEPYFGRFHLPIYL